MIWKQTIFNVTKLNILKSMIGHGQTFLKTKRIFKGHDFPSKYFFFYEHNSMDRRNHNPFSFCHDRALSIWQVAMYIIRDQKNRRTVTEKSCTRHKLLIGSPRLQYYCLHFPSLTQNSHCTGGSFINYVGSWGGRGLAKWPFYRSKSDHEGGIKNTY